MQYNIPITPVSIVHLALGMFKSKKNYYDIITPTEKTSVFVGVYNEEELLPEMLESVINQTERPKEIIISDNGSIDNTLQRTQEFMKTHNYGLLTNLSIKNESIGLYENGKDPKIKLLKYPKKTSKALSMNKAKSLGLINSPWCLLMDSDTYLKTDFLENINNKRYQLRIRSNNSYEIIKSNVLGATVLPRYNKKAGLQERIIRSGRNAEYTYGQIMLRLGQNYIALFVAPGCGCMAYTNDLWMENRTVVEDLEFTQMIQTKRNTKKVSAEDLESILGTEFLEKSYIKTKESKVNLIDIVNENKDIYYTQNAATYVPNAFMVTQDPKTIKSWAMQVERWNGGLQQLRYLNGKKMIKKLRTAWILYGTWAESIVASMMYFGAPFIVAYSTYKDGLFNSEELIKRLGLFAILDLAITSTLLGIGFYKRHRFENDSKTKAVLKSIKDVIVCSPAYLLNKTMNAFEYLYSYAKIAIDYRIKKIRSWNSEWTRPHTTEGAEKSNKEKLYTKINNYTPKHLIKND